MKNVNISIYSKNPITSAGIKNILEFKFSRITLYGRNIDETFSNVELRKTGILFFDDHNIDENELYTCIKMILEINPDIKCIVYTENRNTNFIFRLLGLNVNCLIHKPSTPDSILQAIEAAASDKDFIDEKIIRLFLESRESFNRYNLNRLSEREIAVLELTYKKMTNKDISDTLSISIKTVENHKEKIKKKLGLKTVQELYNLPILEDIFSNV